MRAPATKVTMAAPRPRPPTATWSQEIGIRSTNSKATSVASNAAPAVSTVGETPLWARRISSIGAFGIAASETSSEPVKIRAITR